MKRKSDLFLALVWAALYIPYVIEGGWVRDDLALLTSTRGVEHYIQFQWFVSTNRDMTARPVSAILHGLSYWLLGEQAWPYHLVNLILFGAAVMLFYLALGRFLSRDVALVSSLFVLVYPCASTTVFSSIMMNSNLAAFFWSSGLYVASGDFRWKGILTSALFVMSALSYEVFIPLFGLLPLADLLVLKNYRSDRRRLWVEVMPAIVAVAIYGLYRGLLERAIFHTGFSRIVLSAPMMLVGKFLSSLASGFGIAFVDSMSLSLRALGNLVITPVFYGAILAAVLVLVGAHLYRTLLPPQGADSVDVPARGNRVAEYLGLTGLALAQFGCAHLIYAFSDYVPDSVAFFNRTLGGVGFSTAFLLAALAVPICRGVFGRSAGYGAIAIVIGLFALFVFSISGQREAWAATGRQNAQMATNVTRAIRSEHIDQEEPVRLVAVLPSTFPGQVNGEPSLGVFWDITPLLALYNPGMTISADVYNRTALAGPDGLTIQNFDHAWQAAYPLWLYVSADDHIHRIASQQDWESYLNSPDCGCGSAP